MNETIRVTYNGNKSLEVLKNTKIIDILSKITDINKDEVVGVKIGNSLVNMENVLKKDTTLNFIDANDLAGYKMYQAGLKFILIVALRELYGKDITLTFDHSIMRGIHVSVSLGCSVNNEEILKIKKKMQELIKADLRIMKLNVSSREVFAYYNLIGDIPCGYNVLNIRDEFVTLYKLKNYFGYFYTEMPYSTACLKNFDIVALSNNELVLLFPSPHSSSSTLSYVHYEKVIECFKQEKEWLNKVGIPYIYQVNEWVAKGNVKDLIRLAEVNFDNKIHEVALKIIAKKSRFVMIAGPSSSGKTTTSKKLALDLEAKGYKTLQISVDDYFKDRVDTPKLPDGSLDFESINAIDVGLLNSDINKLLSGKGVKLPKFNFISGKKEFGSDEVTITEDYIILMEGLHCLNNALTPEIDQSLKYKIYLSPFMPLNVDSNNYISTTDLRLIRRLIRDNRTRGHDVSKTIATWQSVRRGEEEYIFPYINTSDVIINTALVYELGVLRVFAEPLLFSVDTSSIYYEEARRLLNFLKIYYPISSEYISDACVLREFIGGSIFE